MKIARINRPRLKTRKPIFDINLQKMCLKISYWLHSERELNVIFRKACKEGLPGRVKLLLANKRVNPSTCDNYGFKMACRYGRTEVVKLLLADKRVNPSAKDNLGFRLACNNGHTEVVELLKQHEIK